MFSCGQCIPCRIRKRREWAHRIMLEAAQYDSNAFVTLTYDDEHLPIGGSLVPRDTQVWLKRLRKSLSPVRVRYYLVGEYGEVSNRPHYHVALFGYPSCSRGVTRIVKGRVSCCVACKGISDSWGNGLVYLGSLEEKSAQYIAGYVVKKMTSVGDKRLGGRCPEFGRMSLRPGVARDAMHEVASELMRYDLDERLSDVPVSLRHGKKKELPLGRYLRQNLRVMIGKDKNAPEASLEERALELRQLREEAFALDKPLAAFIQEKSKGAIVGVIARSHIRRKRSVL